MWTEGIMVVQTISIIPALGLNRYPDSALVTYAKNRVESIKLNELSFPGLSPTPEEVEVKLHAFETALINQRKGEKNTTTAKNIARSVLERSLLVQATNCAEIADGNLETYQKSGYGVKAKSRPAGQLPAPANFRLFNGNMSGSVVAKFKGVTNSHGYELSIVSEDGSIIRAITNSGSPITVEELAPLKRYVVKCRATGARGYQGEWTSELSIGVI